MIHGYRVYPIGDSDGAGALWAANHSRGDACGYGATQQAAVDSLLANPAFKAWLGPYSHRPKLADFQIDPSPFEPMAVVQSDDFDTMARRFTARVRAAADWKNQYVGAAYASRIKIAIATLRGAIAEAEKHSEISP